MSDDADTVGQISTIGGDEALRLAIRHKEARPIPDGLVGCRRACGICLGHARGALVEGGRVGEQSRNLVCGPEGRSCAQKQPESKAGIKEDQQAQRTRDPHPAIFFQMSWAMADAIKTVRPAGIRA